MKTGNFTREYNKNSTKWIVEGFSEQINRNVYPHEGWSWTDWRTEITDTYKTLADARRAISGGYLKDMIEHQRIVDIRIFEVITTAAVVENKIVNSYSVGGEKVEYVAPTYSTDMGALGVGDYLLCGFVTNDDRASLYCRVVLVRDGMMGLEIENGGWTLLLDITCQPPVVHPTSPRIGEDMIGKPVKIFHLGVPDPEYDRGEYDHQMLFYEENFDPNVLTSTLAVA